MHMCVYVERDTIILDMSFLLSECPCHWSCISDEHTGWKLVGALGVCCSSTASCWTDYEEVAAFCCVSVNLSFDTMLCFPCDLRTQLRFQIANAASTTSGSL